VDGGGKGVCLEKWNGIPERYANPTTLEKVTDSRAIDEEILGSTITI